MQLNNIRLLVDNYDDCFIFYRDIMGLTPTWGDLGYNYASFETGAACLSLFKRSEQSQTLGLEHLPIDPKAQDRVAVIFSSDNVDDEVKALRIRGATTIFDPKDYENWGIRAAYLRDPAGNLIEINSPMPREKWSDILRDEADIFQR